ncbi:solute carrier family 23 member 1-like [Clavelina lepadiformis]|uniref:solute carrier family 23 member 1-like n=1 Tax=Clavelina lepadiformis TaxID=159417 RepID=UPI004041009E
MGLSVLRFVDMKSQRNIFIIGFTLFMGLTVANWMKQNPGAIQTGVKELDEIFSVLLSSAMLVGGILRMLLDNTLPGTDAERGIKAWVRENNQSNASVLQQEKDFYDLPFPTNCGRLLKWLPILPKSRHEGI